MQPEINVGDTVFRGERGAMPGQVLKITPKPHGETLVKVKWESGSKASHGIGALVRQADGFPMGAHVELSPACDLWMRGARFGTVIAYRKDGAIGVRMHHPQVKRIQWVMPDYLKGRN